jgi:uncharacterized DUF497 family protein
MRYEWDAAKARANAAKHGVHFADSVIALQDELALTISDPDAQGEDRFISMGLDAYGRLLVSVFAMRADVIRIISSRKASKRERARYEGIE